MALFHKSFFRFAAVCLCSVAGEAVSSGPPDVSAALGKGVTVRSADERFSLSTRVRAQVRGTWLEQEGRDALGAEIRRMRLLFQGQFFGPEWEYYVQLGFSNGDTEPDLRLPLRDAYVTWSGLRDLNVRFGQGKVPFNRQRVVSSSALQFVDRSRTNAELNLDRDVGVQVLSTDLFGLGGRLAYTLGLFGGDGRNRVGTDDGFLSIARVQWSPFGAFDDFVEGDLDRKENLRLAVQAAAALNRSTRRARSALDATYTLGAYDYAHATADVLLKWRGLSIQVEGVYREAVGTKRREDGKGLVETSRSGWGYHAQAGYMVNAHLELVGRVGQLFPVGGITAVTRSGEYGGGLNWYVQGHAFKFQADAFWFTGERFDRGNPQVRLQAQFYL
ncbi:MAG: hypothetical protein RL653_3652 [Pseudomonadota bacterium]|jgi:phosphate-selective porin